MITKPLGVKPLENPFLEDLKYSAWRIQWSEPCGNSVMRCIARAIDNGVESKLVQDFGKDGYLVYAYDAKGLQ